MSALLSAKMNTKQDYKRLDASSWKQVDYNNLSLLRFFLFSVFCHVTFFLFIFFSHVWRSKTGENVYKALEFCQMSINKFSVEQESRALSCLF